MLNDFEGGSDQKVRCVRIRESHRYVAEDLFIASLDAVKESLKFLGPLPIDRSFPDARIEAPRELVTAVDLGDILNLTGEGIFQAMNQLLNVNPKEDSMRSTIHPKVD